MKPQYMSVFSSLYFSHFFSLSFSYLHKISICFKSVKPSRPIDRKLLFTFLFHGSSINGAVKFSAISLSQLSRVFFSIGQRSVMATKYGFFMHACVVTSRHILSMYLWPGTIVKTFNECFKYYDFVGSI